MTVDSLDAVVNFAQVNDILSATKFLAFKLGRVVAYEEKKILLGRGEEDVVRALKCYTDAKTVLSRDYGLNVAPFDSALRQLVCCKYHPLIE